MSENARLIGAAVPGTPSMATSPAYWTSPPGVWKVAVAMLSELTIRIRTRLRSASAWTRPRSTANGPTPASRLPQFWLSDTSALSTDTCRNR